MKKIHRVQIDFTEEGYQRLQDLKKLSGSESITKLMQDALGTYRTLLENNKVNKVDKWADAREFAKTQLPDLEKAIEKIKKDLDS